MSEAFDFSRYAPDRPRLELAWSNPEPPLPGELAQAAMVVKTSARVIALAMAFAAVVIARRMYDAASVRYHRLMRSLTAAWLLAGSGWGLAAGAVTLVLVR